MNKVKAIVAVAMVILGLSLAACGEQPQENNDAGQELEVTNTNTGSIFIFRDGVASISSEKEVRYTVLQGITEEYLCDVDGNLIALDTPTVGTKLMCYGRKVAHGFRFKVEHFNN